jgi:exoribonuclease R
VITIADVAASIPAGSPGDILAQERCQTLYQKGKAVLPMLPRELSEGSLSLLPVQERNGISLHCLWTGTTLQVLEFEEVQLMNSRSYTYESILKSGDYPIHILEAIASHLKGSETKDPHEWIEEFMLLYNREGAKILLQEKAGLLRTHKPADIDRLAKMESIHPDLRFYAFESAKYELTEEGKVHATLGSQPYTHLTSPLRRYADLVNQRVLKAHLQKTVSTPADSSIPAKLNAQQKRQKQHDRDLFFLDQILTKPTGTVTGLVVDSTETKTKVYCPEWKRMIKIHLTSLSPGTAIQVEYYVDLKQVSWKERMVFRLRQEHDTAKDDAENGQRNKPTYSAH